MTHGTLRGMLACVRVGWPLLVLGLMVAPRVQPGAGSAATPALARAVVLGIAQDGGVPHLGCSQELCVRARREPALRQRVAALGLIDERAGQRFLIDATPDFVSQLESLQAPAALRRERPVDGILLTHAHIGHYTGLMHLGREVLGARGVRVFCSPRMAAFLRQNGPWSQLVEFGNIDLVEVEPGHSQRLTPSLTFTFVRVPHRDEFSDTMGVRVEGPKGALLYVPDVDKWGKWDKDLATEVGRVDVALLDGTFASADEIPGRSLAEIPHPLIEETAGRLSGLARRVIFTHLNHTNRLLWDAEARGALHARGFRVAIEGLELAL